MRKKKDFALQLPGKKKKKKTGSNEKTLLTNKYSVSYCICK